MTTQTQTTKKQPEDRLALIGLACSIGLIVTAVLNLAAKIAIVVLS